jgi:hypothetical protein
MSVSIEIWIHISVISAVAVPLVGGALPVVLVTFAAYEVFQSVGSLWTGTANPNVIVFDGWLCFFVAVLLLARFLAGYRAAMDSDAAAKVDLVARLRKPKGVAGATLCATVARIWHAIPRQNHLVPEVAWYSGLQVTAHADCGNGHGLIAVSSALWDRVAKRDPIADLILAHEMGHVVHRDWRTFRRLSAMLRGTRCIVSFSKLFAFGSTAIVLVFMGISEAIHGEALWPTIRLLSAVLAIAALCYLLLVISDNFIRRYVAFIFLLTEVRADTCAALWTVGLLRFSKQLEGDATLRQSTASDLALSFFSPGITHISESERLVLMRTPDRLFTPKLRYFAWSFLVALLLPLNPITPLLFNGAIDHLILISAVAALHAGTMAMLVLSGFSRALSWKRTTVLAMALCLTLGACRFNLYEFGYLLTHYAVAIANDSGFGTDPVSPSVLSRELAIVLVGLSKKAVEGVSGWWILATLPLTVCALKLVRPVVRLMRPQHRKRALVLAVATLTFAFAIAAGRDPNRSDFYDYFLTLLPDGLQAICPSLEPFRLALPAVAALCLLFVLGRHVK